MALNQAIGRRGRAHALPGLNSGPRSIESPASLIFMRASLERAARFACS